MSKNKKGRPFLIVLGAVVILIGLSFLPWSDMTGGRIKDFNLLGDLFGISSKTTAEETLDPELAAALAETMDTDSNEVVTPTTLTADTPGVKYEQSNGVTTIELENPKAPVDNVAGDGTVIIEDYTIDGSGLRNMRRALASVGSRPVRIAVIGDSYIEGDILTMDIRESLQKEYGGAGVGYLPVSSTLTGFRTTVKQTCSGWTQHEIRKNCREGMKTLSGEYFTSNGNGKSTFKGVASPANLGEWNNTMVLAVAPQGGTVTLATDNGTETLQLVAADSVQALTMSGQTSNATVSASNGVEVIGVYLNNSTGICVDNMSLRGNSGQSHRKLSVDRAAQMRPFVDYDLIIVEYGINALSSQQSDYSGYKKLMIQTISRLRECYPNADIVMMGIGDRGQKSGSEVKSVPTSSNMVTAQRDAARQTGVLFWDTRQAMGGEGAVVKWRQDGFINPDYIHLNRKGGKALADLFVKALDKALK